MATIQPMETEAEVNLITSENQPQSPPSEKINPDSVSLRVESTTDSEPRIIEEKRGSFLSRCPPLPKPVNYIIICFLCVCLAPVAYACVTAATVGILPVVLAAFVVVRIIQFFIKSEKFDNHILVLILLRYWIFVVVMLLLVEAGIFYPIAKFVPGLKTTTIIGLSVTKWIKIICTLIGIYLLSQVIWLCLLIGVVQVMGEEDDQSALVVEATSEIVACFLIRWADAVVMNSVPVFKKSEVFGVRNQKWIEVILYLLIGYNIITLFTHIFVWSLPKLYGDHLGIGKSLKSIVCCEDLGKTAFNKRYVVYIACGVKRSVIFILSTVMVLLTWVLYFGDHLNTPSKNKHVLRFGTWTLASILVCSFLWFIKTCILLFWEARTVYDRLHPKIVGIGKQLYFLVLLSYTHYERVFESSTDDSDDSPGCGSSCSSSAPPKKKALWTLLESTADGDVFKTFDRRLVRKGFMNPNSKKASVYEIEQAAKHFMSAHCLVSKDYFSSDLHHLENDDSEVQNTFIVDRISKIFGYEDYSEEDWDVFLKLLPAEHTLSDLSFDKVKTWMERAHSRCRFLVNTLISEKDVVRVLNQVISGIIIVVTFIMWLLLTELATTNVLVLIASPLLAATFIFGDTCKNLFQGLIFVYVVHPFDVGDLCVIDDKLLEVKRIGVWSSVFSKVRTVGKHQEVIYPNSVLATKNVTNHKTEFEWDDNIDFSLSTSDKETTKIMKHEIEAYLDAAKDRFVPNFHSVEFLEIGEKAKIAVHIKHSVKTEGWTYFECLKEKERRRFEFVLDIQNLVNLHETKTETIPGNLEATEQQITGDH